MNLSLLTRLTEATGIPSQEQNIRKIVREELGKLCEFEIDSMGNLICLRKATKPPKSGPTKKLMIAAHMDEIGFVVKHIDDKGFLRIHPLGGFDPRQMFSQRVVVTTASGPLVGTLNYATKPKHLLTEAEAAAKPVLDNFMVDVGLDGEKAKKKISLGDMVTMHRPLEKIGQHLCNKAMDDRAGVYVMIEALKAAKSCSVDVYAVATSQEEIGLRGAIASGAGIKPDICVALDVTLANDFPGIPDQDCITKLGQGTAIKILDGSLICTPELVKHFKQLAEKNKIKHQMEILPMGGTDAGGVQRQNGGVPSITLSVPTRYIHTVNETVHPDDLDASVDLLARYIEDAHNGSYVPPE